MRIENEQSVTDAEGVIIGRNAVREALQAGINIDKVFVDKTRADTDAVLGRIAAAAREAGAVVLEAEKRKLDRLCIQGGREDGSGCGKCVHQGVVALAASVPFSTIDEIIALARQRGEQPLIIVCDGISDPHNLGAIIRTCEAAGAHGVIVPKRRSAGLGSAVAKVSSGAVFHMKVARVPNITAALRELKKLGVWIFGAEAEDGAAALWESDFTDATAIVIGSEAKGISKLASGNCDFHVTIPMNGRLSSLNASVAASILLYEAVRQRR